MIEKRITAIIQARMTSTRLPGKVMKEVLGQPLLSYLIERVRCCRKIEDVILATTFNTQDDPIAKFGEGKGVNVFRGSENNVLERFHKAAKMFHTRHIMRVTADCPLIDPDILDMLIEYYFAETFDYVSNCADPTLPDGLDAEIFSSEALDYAYKNAALPSELEHVTPYIRNHPEIFKTGNWTYHENLSHLRWTVDESEDFEFVKQIIESLYPVKRDFRMNDVLEMIRQRPELTQINAHITRNEGFRISLEEDMKLLENRTN